MARRRDRLDDLAAAIGGDGGTALVVQADVTRRDEATEAVEQTIAALGRIDTVVNNAGIMLLGPALDAPIGEWEQMLAVNVHGLLYVTHAALPHLVRAAADSPRGVADLVNISSTAGRVARAGSSVYNLTKFGLTAFSEALRQEMLSRRVRGASSSLAPSTPSSCPTFAMTSGKQQPVRQHPSSRCGPKISLTRWPTSSPGTDVWRSTRFSSAPASRRGSGRFARPKRVTDR